jgi:hypothetical protein
VVFKSKTVFVIGAGASHEVKLPLGSGLKADIGQRLTVVDSVGRQPIFADDLSHRTLDSYFTTARINRSLWSEYMSAAESICRNMPLAPSIDNYLYTHQDNRYINTCGKIGILISILEAERNSLLYADPDELYIDHKKLADTWFDRLVKMLFTDVTVSQVDRVFENVSFIIFNYDRCVEFYLEQAVRSYFGLDPADSQALVRKLRVFHPYGQLGSLPWQMGSSRIGFGDVVTTQGGSCIENIRTFSERVQESQTFDLIKQEIVAASTIVFLGFAYHPLNMQVLQPTSEKPIAKNVFGTCLGVSQQEQHSVTYNIQVELLSQNGATVQLPRHTTCVSLLDAFSRTLPHL